MKQIEKIASATQFSAINMGKWSDLNEYVLELGPEVKTIEEGSVVRVAPEGKRSVRNNGTAPLVMLCVQYRGNTFTAADATDGVILNEPVKW